MKKNKKIKSIQGTGLGTGAIIGISIGGILLVGGISYLVYNFVSSDSSGGGGGGGGSSLPGPRPVKYNIGGLQNITGNSCFSNALLQAMFYCSHLKNDILNLNDDNKLHIKYIKDVFQYIENKEEKYPHLTYGYNYNAYTVFLHHYGIDISNQNDPSELFRTLFGNENFNNILEIMTNYFHINNKIKKKVKHNFDYHIQLTNCNDGWSKIEFKNELFDFTIYENEIKQKVPNTNFIKDVHIVNSLKNYKYNFNHVKWFYIQLKRYITFTDTNLNFNQSKILAPYLFTNENVYNHDGILILTLSGIKFKLSSIIIHQGNYSLDSGHYYCVTPTKKIDDSIITEDPKFYNDIVTSGNLNESQTPYLYFFEIYDDDINK